MEQKFFKLYSTFKYSTMRNEKYCTVFNCCFLAFSFLKIFFLCFVLWQNLEFHAVESGVHLATQQLSVLLFLISSCWDLWCDQLCLRRCNNDITTSDRNQQENKLWIFTQPSFLKLWVLLGLLTGIWMRGNLEDQKWLNNSYISKAYPNMCSSSWKLGIGSTLHSLETTDKRTVFRSGGSVSLSLLQIAKLVFGSPKQFGWSLLLSACLAGLLPSSWACLKVFFQGCLVWKWLSIIFAVYILRKWEGSRESGQFQWFSEVILNCSLSVLRHFLPGWDRIFQS